MSKARSITSITVEGNNIIPYFDKFTRRYNLFLDEVKTNIYISVTKEKDDDFVDGIGKVKLKEGKNIINIVVNKLNKDQEHYYLVVHNGEVKEEDNTYLEDLSVVGYDINFDKDILNYYINIDDIEEVKVKYVPTSEKQNIKVEGNTNLKSGNNQIIITVSLEDGKRIYVINVNKLAPVFQGENNEIKTIFNKTDLNEKEKIVIIISISSICLVIILFVYYLLFIIKRRHI